MVKDPPTDSAGSELAQKRWRNTPLGPARTAATEPARRAGIAPFEDIVDPEGVLPAAERAQRATRAYFAELGKRSAQARKDRKAAAGGAA